MAKRKEQGETHEGIRVPRKKEKQERKKAMLILDLVTEVAKSFAKILGVSAELKPQYTWSSYDEDSRTMTIMVDSILQMRNYENNIPYFLRQEKLDNLSNELAEALRKKQIEHKFSYTNRSFDIKLS